jgi:hypothetical protein
MMSALKAMASPSGRLAIAGILARTATSTSKIKLLRDLAFERFLPGIAHPEVHSRPQPGVKNW